MTKVPVVGSTATSGAYWLLPSTSSLGLVSLAPVMPSVPDESSLTSTGVLQVRPSLSEYVRKMSVLLVGVL